MAKSSQKSNSNLKDYELTETGQAFFDAADRSDLETKGVILSAVSEFNILTLTDDQAILLTDSGKKEHPLVRKKEADKG